MEGKPLSCTLDGSSIIQWDNKETIIISSKIEVCRDCWNRVAQKGGIQQRKKKVSTHTNTHARQTVTDSSAITQMDLERHFTMFALCLGPPEDLVSLKTNRPLIWKLGITGKNRSKPLPSLWDASVRFRERRAEGREQKAEDEGAKTVRSRARVCVDSVCN